MGYTSTGLVAAHKTKILVFITLIITWTIAGIGKSYKTEIKSKVSTVIKNQIANLPKLKIDYHPNRDPRTAYNSSKLAMLIESRPLPHLVPQMLHMISVVPPDWRFLFIGSNSSVTSVSRSLALRYHIVSGKLDVMVAPPPWGEVHDHPEDPFYYEGFGLKDKESVYRMMTDLRFYEEVMPDVEWLLKYEADSIMCANSERDLDDWLHLSWAGAPRNENDRWAGNGGLSLRRLSAIRRVLSFQSRYNNTGPEDEWFGTRIPTLPDVEVASANDEKHFSVEDVYYEKPMGYHVRAGAVDLNPEVWDGRERRQAIFDYCPELSLIMPMKLERERCPEDTS